MTKAAKYDLSKWIKDVQLKKAAEQDPSNWTKKRSWTWLEKLNKIWALEQRQFAETD